MVGFALLASACQQQKLDGYRDQGDLAALILAMAPSDTVSYGISPLEFKEALGQLYEVHPEGRCQFRHREPPEDSPDPFAWEAHCPLRDESGISYVHDNLAGDDRVEITLEGVRSMVSAMRVRSRYPNSIRIPERFMEHAEVVGCAYDNLASGGEVEYRIALPERRPIYIFFSWSGGSGGEHQELRVSKSPKEEGDMPPWTTRCDEDGRSLDRAPGAGPSTSELPTPSGDLQTTSTLEAAAGVFEHDMADLVRQILEVGPTGEVRLVGEPGAELVAILSRNGRRPGATEAYHGRFEPGRFPGPVRLTLSSRTNTLLHQELMYEAANDTWILLDRAPGENSGPVRFRRVVEGGAATVAPLNSGPIEQLRLRSGFPTDPRKFSVRAGGPLSSEGWGPGCAGYVSESPTLILDYSASDHLPLNFYAIGRSGLDATLVVRDPVGRVLCNDDYSGLDPAVPIPFPESGRYEVWVGVWSQGTGQAELFVSELAPQFERR